VSRPVVSRAGGRHLNGMSRNALAILGCACSLATVFAGASCGTSNACVADSSGYYLCDGYVGAYPYDYAYVDPLYLGPGGYYPYTVDTYYDPLGYDTVVTYNSLRAAPVPVADPTAGSDVPELLDKARRAANAINAGVRAALDPIEGLIKTPPRQNGETVVYGPADHAGGNYQFTMRWLSEAESRFGWKLEARPQGSAGAFSRVAGGLIRVGETQRRGRGALGVDCTALASADASVTCRGTLMIGFAHTGAGDKILSIGLRAYTADVGASAPADAAAFAWRQGDSANRVRLVARTNLSTTATPAQETVAIKLAWLKDVGVRADAIATGGDIAPGQTIVVSTCVSAGLGAMTPTCGAGLEAGDQPDADPLASDPPLGMPEMPEAPATMPDGDGG
jgi:hypothetical protein